MKRFVRIESGIVVEAIERNDDFEPAAAYHSDLIWVESKTAALGDLWDGESFSMPAPEPLTVGDYDRALTDHLDAVARQRRYDNRITCALRAGFPGPWQAEGIAFASWMDQCNAQAYQLWQDVAAGLADQPTIDSFIASLPTMQWPE